MMFMVPLAGIVAGFMTDITTQMDPKRSFIYVMFHGLIISSYMNSKKYCVHINAIHFDRCGVKIDHVLTRGTLVGTEAFLDFGVARG